MSVTYFSMLHPNGFNVRNLSYERERGEVPFENGTVSEVLPGSRTVDIACHGGRRWDDIIHGTGGQKYFYFSDRAKSVIESTGFAGIDFYPVTVRKTDVPKLMQESLRPKYWLGRITGHVRAVEIWDEARDKHPFNLDETGLRILIQKPPGVAYTSHFFVGRPLLTDATPDFVEPAPMRMWTVLVSERVANAFKEAKLTGYKLNPLRPGGFCPL